MTGAGTFGLASHFAMINTWSIMECAMPAKSQAQQKAAGAALSAKRGELPKSRLKGASLDMYESMSEKELDDLASTKRSKLPEHKEQR